MHSLLEERGNRYGVPFQVLLSIFVAGLLYLPEFRMYQSLGLNYFNDLSTTDLSVVKSLVKLAFTVICTSLPFLGGEFVPLVFAGVHLGGGVFQAFGSNSVLGAACGAFLLFAAASRLKWTAFFLMTALMGFGWMLWIFFVLTVALSFSGDGSLYKKFGH